MGDHPVTTPEVTWAQRSSSSEPSKNIIYLTVFAPDVPKKDLTVDLHPTKLKVTGKSTTKNATYHVELEFYAEVDPAESKTHHTDRDVVFALRKKEAKDEYWPRLTKDKAKLHFLKTDFDRWVDEDEQEGAAMDEEFMANMGGMGGDGGFGGIDFSKLGGAGGMPDLGAMGGAGGAGGEEDDGEEDNEMPDLEEEDDAKGKVEAAASKPKIEEVS